MVVHRIAGFFLAMVLAFLSPGSATAGLDEGFAAYEEGDYHAALNEFVPLARVGNAWAQGMLGAMYEASQNYADAAKWYRRAATQGLALAQSLLGELYRLGEGVAQDYSEAVRWLRLGAEQGDPLGQFSLGVMYRLGQGVPQNYAEAVRWYRLAANQGHAKAQHNLGVMYQRGQGVSQNYTEAARWYRVAATQGVAEAQSNLGVMYQLGEGVPQNDAEAVRWFRLAANQGHGLAQGKLGVRYLLGQGAPQDHVQAYAWLNLGAAQLPQGEERTTIVALRDEVAAGLSPADRARGQELARNWRPESQPVPQVASPPRALTAGDVDGVRGARIRAAIRAFEADVGLPVDGQVSDRLTVALSDARPTGRSAAAHIAAADPGSEGEGARPWERYAKARRLEGTGTGFAVSQDGQIVTNHHVVADCAEVRVRPAGQDAMAGAVVARDAGNDLALVKAPVRLPVAAIREDRGIRAGDSVVAVGFPLPGLLASEANVTTGSVSALAGIGNDTRFLQMTVPVQPGNSGGPLLDLEGRVVGVVVGKLDALQVASVTGDIPQNVNFAIKAEVVQSFLNAGGVGLGDAVAGRADPPGIVAYPISRSPATIGAEAKAFTVLVECWR